MRATTTALALTLLIGCGGTQHPRDEDLTADEHEAEAEAEEQAADEHDAQYQTAVYGTDVYNPIDVHQAEAQSHREHAEAHRQRAAELRSFQEEHCAHFPDETRASCPLLLHLEQVEDVEGGSRLTFEADQDIEPVIEHVRCHLAFAAAQGREDIDHCALYVPGTVMAVEEHIVTLTTDQDDQVAELRMRVARQAP